MSIVLNGTTGVTTPDVTSDGLTVDSTTLVVDETNNRVGVGTSSPISTLHIESDSDTEALVRGGSNGNATIKLIEQTTDFNTGASFQYDGDINFGKITAHDGFSNPSAPDKTILQFPRNGSRLEMHTNGLERARIDSSGNLLVGTTSPPVAGRLALSSSTRNIVSTRPITTSATHIGFFNPNGEVGSIRTSGTSTSFNTSSDYRLKEDWVAVADASTRVNALKPVNFAWKVDGSRVDGFLAHELAEVVPEAVTGEKDAMRDEEYEVTPAVLDDDGNVVTPAVMGTRSVPDYQGIDQSKLVPLLTAALQEALSEINDLKARVSALEAANV